MSAYTRMYKSKHLKLLGKATMGDLRTCGLNKPGGIGRQTSVNRWNHSI